MQVEIAPKWTNIFYFSWLFRLQLKMGPWAHSDDTQVVNAQAAHVAAVLISNSDDTGFIRLEADQPVSASNPPNITTPSASLPQNSGRPLYDALASGQALTVTFTAATLPTGNAKSWTHAYMKVPHSVFI